jgi:hypothetical protein
MKYPRLACSSVLAVLCTLPAACATSRSAGTKSAPVAAVDPVPLARPARPLKEAPRGPTLDRQGCDKKGKLTVVEEPGPNGKTAIWRYYAQVKHGGTTTRVLKCEASDNNGDGFIDARFFYDDNGQLVLEQRDLDFDGHAEVITDYSRFSFGHLVQASNKEEE